MEYRMQWKIFKNLKILFAILFKKINDVRQVKELKLNIFFHQLNLKNTTFSATNTTTKNNRKI